MCVCARLRACSLEGQREGIREKNTGEAKERRREREREREKRTAAPMDSPGFAKKM